MSATVVARCDASPVFQAPEHVFDKVALAILPWVVSKGDLAVPLWRDTRFDAAFDQGAAKPVAVISPVPGEDFGSWQGGQKDPCPFVIAHLAFGQKQDQGFAVLIGDGVQLRVQAALGPADTAGNRPFFKRLAAVR